MVINTNAYSLYPNDDNAAWSSEGLILPERSVSNLVDSENIAGLSEYKSCMYLA